MNEENFTWVGKPVVRQDGVEKVTGSTKFAEDYNFPDQLYGVMVRIPAAHARIDRVDYSKIENDLALFCICDAADIPGAKKVGPIRKDQPIFCHEKVVTPGDVLAMLLGESEEKLKKLGEQVKVVYEPLPVLTDPRQALESGAPLIHPEYDNNLIVHYPLRKGNVSKGFAESDGIIEQTYTTPFIEHAYLEPEAVIAIPLEGRKGIKIIGSIQNPFTTRKVVAEALGWPLARVRVVQAELGGSFGGKDDTMNILSARAAVGALKTGRPVKIRYSREESILESYKRHAYIMNYKAGFTNDGKIKAMEIDILADGGAYASMTPFVTWRSVVQATGPYEIEHVRTDVRGVYTNNPYTGAMRGFGSPQPIFAQESLMDEIAIRLGMRPDEIRRINGYQRGSVTASGQKLQGHDVNLLEVMRTAVKQTNFTEKWEKNRNRNAEVPLFLTRNRSAADPDSLILNKAELQGKNELVRKGIGLAISFRGCSLGAEGIDAAAAYLSLQQDGSVYLLSGLAENGQGMRTTFSIIAAEVLGISVEDVYYLDQDTGFIPDSGPTVASRSTIMGGSAVKDAAEKVRHELEKVFRENLQLADPEKVVFRNKRVYSEKNPAKRMDFTELCNVAYRQGVLLAALGWYPGPKVHWDESTGQGNAYFTYVYGCQVAEVTVNVGTGEVIVDQVVAVHNPGKVINRTGAEGQVFGGVTQGAGYALWEEISSKDGYIRELNFDQYLLPTSKDLGPITPLFVEGKDRFGPWGGKSLGEPTLELTSAAIANAVCNAVGRRYFDLPLDLEKVILHRKLRPEDLIRGSAQ